MKLLYVYVPCDASYSARLIFAMACMTSCPAFQLGKQTVTMADPEKVLTDAEIDALEIYLEPDVTEDVDGPSIGQRGYIYIIQETENHLPSGYYQVGRTGNPRKRLSDLQPGNVRPLLFTRAVKVTDVIRAEEVVLKALEAYSASTYGGGTGWYFVDAQKSNEFYNHSFGRSVAPFRRY